MTEGEMKTLFSRAAVVTVSLLAVALPATAAQAQQKFPNKPIRMLVPFSVGSATDILGRLVGQKMSENWGQPVVVDNRPGAGGTIASQYVLGAQPDGHTVMVVSAGHAANATLYSKLPYDTVKDFSGVSQLASVPNVLVVGRELGVKSVKDLIALAKSKPGQLNFSSAGIGSGTHLNGEMFKVVVGLNVIHVPYKGAPEALSDAIAGRVQYTFSPILVVAPSIRDGRVLALAVSTASRSPMFPDIPTVAEAGVPGFDFDLWIGLLASATTPRPLINQLNKEITRVLALSDIKERMLTMGVTPKPSTPEQFDAFIRSEVARHAKVIEASGARIN
jgi:tripartite-type tricarboxylate transporter receptor subunit TctC